MVPEPETTALSSHELDDVDRKIIKMLLGAKVTPTNEQIGEALGYSRNQIQIRRTREIFVEAMRELEMSTEDHLKEAAARAARRVKKLVDHDDPKIAEPFVKMALHKQLSKTTVDVNLAQKTIYRSTVQVDGTLLQEVLQEELDGTPSAPTDTANPVEKEST